MSTNKKLTLEDLQNAKHHEVHWSVGYKAPHEDTSIFTIQNEDLGGCDRRAKIRMDGNHALAGAEKNGDTIIYHAKMVVDAFVKDYQQTYGTTDPRLFRCGATVLAKQFLGEEYRLIATAAFKQLKEIYDESHTS